MDLLTLEDAAAELLSILEALRNQRQDLRPKRWEPQKDHIYDKGMRRVKRGIGTKRKTNPTEYNRRQRERYHSSRTGTKVDGKKGVIPPKRKVLGQVLNPKQTLRGRI
jgi:hypothetical protein